MKREYITKKEDFNGKYIKMPSNLSKKKWDKIKLKLGRLGFENFEYCEYCDLYIYADQCLFIWKDGSIGIWCEAYALEQIKQPKVISIKDFLAEPKEDDNAYLSVEEIKESKDGIYIKGKIKNYNPHLKIAGIEIPYYPVCLNEEEDSYIIEVEGVKIKVPNEYSSIRHMAIVMDGCYIYNVCPCCGKNTRIQVSKGDDWVCPHCLDGEQKESDNILLSDGMLKPDEDIFKEFEDGFEGLSWCKKNPYKEIAFNDNNSHDSYLVRYNKKLNYFQKKVLLGRIYDDNKWKRLFTDGYTWRFAIKSMLCRWVNIREYEEMKNIITVNCC